MEHLADLYETNWTPPEPVSDDDLLAARAHAKASGWAATAVDAGSCDHTDGVVSFLAGCARGRKGAKGLVEALEEAERFLEYFAGYRTGFVGPGTPSTALEQVRAALASAKRGG